MRFRNLAASAADTTAYNLNAEVIVVSPKANDVQKYIVYTSEQLSYNDEKPLENTKCMHADVLHMMCIGKEERLVQFEILASSGLDVHASTGNQTK